ncbi:symporter [Bifidobacterium animalis subsp. animalis]|nr:symporter [Bifidobacterium animalis subsp. animalis]
MKQVTRQGFNALFPCATGLWWYTTSYVLFLLICPLLTRGLRQLSFKAHASLFVALILIYGFTPNVIFPLNNTYTFVLFVYLYILMTFLRWRVPQVCANRSFAKKLIYIGLIFGLGSQIIVQCFSPSKTYNMTPLWLNSPRCLPSMCIGFGLLVLAFSAKNHYNKIVNRFAASTLSIYLVGASPFVLLNQSSIAERIPLLGGIGAIAILSGLLLCLYICVLLFDLVRQYIYTITVDRNNSEQASWICKNLLSLRETIWNFGKKLITE